MLLAGNHQSYWQQHGDSILAGIGIVGSLGTLVFGLLSVYFYLRQQAIKTLDYEVLTDISLLRLTPLAATDDLEVRYGGVLLEYPRAVEIKICCTGRQAIRPTDFASPIELQMPRAAKIISWSHSLPGERTVVEPIPGRGGLMIQPCLFNPKDELSISMLVDWDKHVPLNLKARIADLKRPPQRIDEQKYAKDLTRTIALTAVALVASVISMILGFRDLGRIIHKH